MVDYPNLKRHMLVCIKKHSYNVQTRPSLGEHVLVEDTLSSVLVFDHRIIHLTVKKSKQPEEKYKKGKIKGKERKRSQLNVSSSSLIPFYTDKNSKPHIFVPL